MSDDVTARLLSASYTLFTRHGFQRTGMADVARAAGVARATLYLRFRDKHALFQALAAQVVRTALDDAEAAWVHGAVFADNLLATILAKDLPLWRMMHAPHGAELLLIDAAQTRAHVETLNREFAAILARRAPEAGLEVFGGADGFGAFMAMNAAGLKHEAQTEQDFVTAVRRLCRVAARACGADGRESHTREAGS